MVQLHVLTGAEAGKRFDGKSFPLKVGRGARNSVSLADPGVFEEHFSIDFTHEGFVLSTRQDAPITVNGENSAGGILRNGDVIGAGLAKVQFWLGPMRQLGLKAREIFAWLLVAGMAALQVYFFIRLLEMARS